MTTLCAQAEELCSAFAAFELEQEPEGEPILAQEQGELELAKGLMRWAVNFGRDASARCR